MAGSKKPNFEKQVIRLYNYETTYFWGWWVQSLYIRKTVIYGFDRWDFFCAVVNNLHNPDLFNFSKHSNWKGIMDFILSQLSDRVHYFLKK